MKPSLKEKRASLLPKLICSLVVAILSATSLTAAPDSAKAPPVTTLSPMARSMEWVGKAVDEPDYYVWCTSPIMGDDKKVHLFCSRWPKRYKMLGWKTHSEIAHYVADKPEGPFRFVDVALPANPGAPWNNSMHNPAIARADGKWVLLYISFDYRKKMPYLTDGRFYTAMAVSKSLNGPWKKLGDDGMIFTPSADPNHWTYQAWAMDNPTFLAYGGKYYIYFKAGKQQRKSRYGYAVADRLEGPYRLSDTPCTDNIDYIEDATAFVWNGKVCLLTNDNYGTHTGKPGQGILWRSDVPTHFSLRDAEIGFRLVTDYYQADLSKVSKLYGQDFKFERPGILMIDGKPAYFYGPSGLNLEGADHTCSYVLKIKLP